MNEYDLKWFALIGAAVVLLIDLAKSLPKVKDWVKDREKKLAVLLPVLFVVVMKAFFGKFQGTSWEWVVLTATADGGAAGWAHDKVWDPIKSIGIDGVKSVLKLFGIGKAGPPEITPAGGGKEGGSP